MIRRIPKRRLRWLAWPLLACFALQPIAAVQTAQASVRFEDQDSIGQASPLAPADGERLSASAVRFAYELPRDAAKAQVVVARVPFDPRAWKSVPDDDAYAVVEATGGLVSLAAFPLAITAPTELWWAVATTDKTTGRLRVSPVRSFTALPRFTNRVAPSPYLLETRRGLLGAGERVVSAAPPHLRLAAGYDFVPATDGAPGLPADLSGARIATDDPAAAGGEHSYLVQFAAPPSDAERAAIAQAGGAVFSYIPDQAFLVRMSAQAKDRLAAQGRALWIGEYEPAYKMSPLLKDKSVPMTGQYLALVFPDADARQAAQALGLLGYTVEAISDNGVNKLVRFRAPAEGLAAAAGLPAVAWVEPVAVKTTVNDQASWVVQTNVLNDRRVWGFGIRGQGQVVNTTDSGINTTHDMFRDPAVPLLAFGDYPTHRKIIGYKIGSSSPAVQFGDHGGANSYHGSHTAGTMVGNDDVTGGVSAYDGMAKEAKIFFMDISGTSLANSVVPYDDLNDLYLPPYTGNAGGAARISSNSWGAPVNGAYDLNAMQVDQFTWSHPDFYIAFSTGNSTTAGSVGSPATSKNCAGMGGTQNGASAGSIYSPTSRGPTADGRRKPTFCSPGQTVRSAQAPPNFYAALSGTSMASPSGTGAVVLIRQYLTDGFYPTGAAVPANGFAPSAALLKAMAINSADNGVLGFTAPDNNIGYGRIHIDNVLYFPGDARKLLLQDNTDGLGQGQYIEYQINVTDVSQPLEVSLCWTDYPGSPVAGTQLVNNLDLTVTNGASTYKGNVYAAGVSTTGGSADNLNVEESVLVPVPSAGLWTVRVAAPTVPVGPQPFGLCVTGGVGQAAGALALDRAEYGSTSTVDLQVVDTDALSPLTVHVTSTTEPAGEDVSLTGANGVFNGTLALTPLGVTPSNGALSVSNGDALSATYNDASPVASLVANAAVSFATPVITYVKATSQGASGTLVTFNTNVNATDKVYYGLTPALELGSLSGVGARLAHQVLIPGLTPGATYYYDVEATALNGNVVRDDLGGAHYRFTAKSSGDILLVVGEVGYPRLTAWQSALTALNYDYDLWMGPLADNPDLGNLTTGMRSYKAVLWQAGIDQYPPFDDTQRTAVTNYLDGGGRIAAIGHDIGWALGDLTSGYSSVATQQWLAGTLKATFQADPATWSVATGYALDPISGSYTGGVPYTPVRTGGAGDEIDIAVSPPPGGPASYIWRDNATPDDCGLRWESAVPNGSAGTALWGGAPSRLVDMFFEFTALDPPFTSPSAIRQDILNKTILWLIGRDRPNVALTSPNGGETLTGTSAPITWSETIGGGYAADGRTVEYSIDGGDSWTTLTTSAGPSPYPWDLTAVPNSTKALVRVRVTDNGAPALSQGDVSNAVFTIARPGGDILGPVVVAGSIASSPNPIVRPVGANLTATVSDAARGASAIAAAEWSIGNAPAGAGAGTPLSLGGSGVTIGVNGALDTYPFNVGVQKIWVRAQDIAGNWGPATALAIQVNGPDPVGVPPIPRVAFLSQNAPNPFVQTTSVRYGLPVSGRAELGVYTVQGRLVRRLVSGLVEAGEHVATWDGRDDAGRRVAAGVYYYALVTPQGRFDKKMLALP